jgi:RimJ/RimL family protein N-acetyltransferase
MIPGKRVRLRAFRDDDLKNALAAINNAAVTRYLRFMQPVSVHQEREWLERSMRGGHPDQLNLAIESSDGEYLGSVGLMHIDLRNRDAELGILIGRPDDWGKGFGTEAALLMLRHGFEEMNLHRITCACTTTISAASSRTPSSASRKKVACARRTSGTAGGMTSC